MKRDAEKRLKTLEEERDARARQADAELDAMQDAIERGTFGSWREALVTPVDAATFRAAMLGMAQWSDAQLDRAASLFEQWARASHETDD